MTEEEKIVFARTNKTALDELLKKYTPLVKSVCARFFLHGGEPEDLEQGGMVGLYSAINTYASGGANFSTYAYVCVRNAVVSAVKKSVGAKQSALNDFVPIVEVGEAYFETPEDELIKRENKREFLQKIAKELSSLEFKTTEMRLEGMSAGEIARSLDKPLKSVTNALARAKVKLEKLYKEEK